jgi:hypothetical protein
MAARVAMRVGVHDHDRVEVPANVNFDIGR